MSDLTVPHLSSPVKSQHKAVLVELGLWGLNTGRPWLIKAVYRALWREGLIHA